MAGAMKRKEKELLATLLMQILSFRFRLQVLLSMDTQSSDREEFSSQCRNEKSLKIGDDPETRKTELQRHAAA